jgi:hypothetical protein
MATEKLYKVVKRVSGIIDKSVAFKLASRVEHQKLSLSYTSLILVSFSNVSGQCKVIY